MVVSTVSLEHLARKYRSAEPLTLEEMERLVTNGEYLLTPAEHLELQTDYRWERWWKRRQAQS